MKRQFAVNIVLLVLINLLIKPVYIFFIEAKVQDVLGHVAYGKYFTYLNFALLFQFMADLGTQSWNAQHLSKNRQDSSFIISNVFFLRMVLGIVYVLITSLLAWSTGWFDMMLLIYLSLQVFLSASLVFIRSSITALGHFKTDNLLSVADKILMIAGLGWMLYFLPEKDFSITDFVRIQIAALVFANILAIFLLIWQGAITIEKPDFFSYRSILRNSFPYMLIGLLMMAYNKLDGVLLGVLSDKGTEASGVYAVAFRIYDAMNMMSYLMAALLLPMFASLIGERKYPGDLAILAFQMMWTISLPIVLVLITFPQQILDIVYSTPQDQAIQALQWLSIAFIMINIGYIFGTLIVAADQGVQLLDIFIMGVVINVVGNMVLIPIAGPAGAAIVCLATQAFVAAGQFHKARNLLQIKISRQDIVAGIKFSALSIAGMLFLYLLEITWYYIALISLLISILLSHLTGWLNWNKMYAWKK